MGWQQNRCLVLLNENCGTLQCLPSCGCGLPALGGDGVCVGGGGWGGGEGHVGGAKGQVITPSLHLSVSSVSQPACSQSAVKLAEECIVGVVGDWVSGGG